MKKEKQLFLDQISDQVNASPTFLIAQYDKLTANQANEFRRKMQNVGVSFEVVRKRMLLKAAEKSGVKLSLEMLPGHIGVLFIAHDPIEATKAVLKFSDDNEKCMQLLGAQMEGHLISKEDVQALSKIPPKNELRAQFLGLLEAPMAETLGVMDALLTSVLHCVNNKSKEA